MIDDVFVNYFVVRIPLSCNSHLFFRDGIGPLEISALIFEKNASP
jgi:hypothetical protein